MSNYIPMFYMDVITNQCHNPVAGLPNLLVKEALDALLIMNFYIYNNITATDDLLQSYHYWRKSKNL